MCGGRRERVGRWGLRRALRRAGVGLALTGLLLSVGAVAQAPAPEGAAAVDSRLDTLFGEHESYRNFLQDLQAAVRANARERIAAMVSYPLKTHIEGREVSVRTPREFMQRFDALLPPATQTVIAQQSYESLFANSEGVMIGRGELWFSGVCADERCQERRIKIIAINP